MPAKTNQPTDVSTKHSVFCPSISPVSIRGLCLCCFLFVYEHYTYTERILVPMFSMVFSFEFGILCFQITNASLVHEADLSI